MGDLTENVDDYDLYKTFKDRYPSTKGAKVVLEPNGESRGFGFVRFSSSMEQIAALKVVNLKPLLMSNALEFDNHSMIARSLQNSRSIIDVHLMYQG